MDLTGIQIDKYFIKRKLGQGGMADVYLALDTVLERDVALKIIRTEMFPPVELDRILQRFSREAKLLAKLYHPNIIHILDYGEYQGEPYLVMQYHPGGSLKEFIKGAIPWQEAFKLMLPIIEAVEYAHQNEILHRDIKPSNILLTANGTPVITDFGVAKILSGTESTLSSTGLGIGTPAYMAPEQWNGKAEYSSDQYALGTILYQLLSGQLPYSADTPLAVFTKVIRDPLTSIREFRDDVPVNVENLITKMLLKDPKFRFSDLSQVVKTMVRLLDEDTKQIPEPIVETQPQTVAIPLNTDNDQTDLEDAKEISEQSPKMVQNEFETPVSQSDSNTHNDDEQTFDGFFGSQTGGKEEIKTEKKNETTSPKTSDVKNKQTTQVNTPGNKNNRSDKPAFSLSMLQIIIGVIGIIIIAGIFILPPMIDDVFNSVAIELSADATNTTSPINKTTVPLATATIAKAQNAKPTYTKIPTELPPTFTKEPTRRPTSTAAPTATSANQGKLSCDWSKYVDDQTRETNCNCVNGGCQCVYRTYANGDLIASKNVFYGLDQVLQMIKEAGNGGCN